MSLPIAPRRWAAVALIVLAALRATCAVADAGDVLKDLGAAMGRARAAQDWPAYLIAAKRQAELLNGSPMSRLEVARAQARVLDFDAALDELRAFVQMGQSSQLLDTLPELAPLRELPAFAAIRKQSDDNRQPIARPSLAFRVKDRSLLAEDLEYDPARQRFFISSILQKKIVTATMRGDIGDFARSPDVWPVLALKIDRARQLLWASEVAMEGFESVAKSAQGRSALLCYELRSGKLLQRIEGPRPSALGDITLTADGAVIASDGQHGGIYRARRGETHMERIDAGDFISPQTSTIAADGTHVIVPDYVRGLGILALDTKRVTWMPTQGRYALNGVDGLYRSGTWLLAVQNGTSPERIVMFSMDPDGHSIVSQDILERSTPTLGDPTHGVIAGDSFYYLANSGWDVIDDSGKIKPGMALTEPLVMKARLHPRQ